MNSALPTIPSKIYKYQPPSIQAITNLSDAKIWFSDPRAFNDPFDCAIEVIAATMADSLKSLDAATALEILLSNPNQHQVAGMVAQMREAEISRIVQQTIVAGFSDALQRLHGVCCFSEKFDDLTMWGHYADSHRGFCLEFRLNLRRPGVPGII